MRTQQHKDHKEWFCARRYLLALAEAGRLAFPITVRKGESPDFTIEWPDGSISGLEIAEATTEEFQRALTETEGKPGPHRMGPPAGWAGDEVEQEMADTILTQARKKVAKMLGPNWRTADRHDLLLYSNGGWIGPDIEHLTAIVREPLAGFRDDNAVWPNGPLGFISLLQGSSVAIDIGGSGDVVSIQALHA